MDFIIEILKVIFLGIVEGITEWLPISSTGHMLLVDEFIKMISGLLEKGYAYIAGGNVYFDTSKLDKYYTLSSHNEDDLMVGVRDDVDVDENKRNKTDFVLWFTKSKFDDQELKWDSPWGVGYPGWHIECSCISMKHLGENLDLHCGGIDNIFPHHTNEIAQSEAYIGHKWCNYWFHVHHLNDKQGKMSKSKGDFLTVSLLEKKGYNPLVYRMFCLQSHYRKPLQFSYEVLDSVAAGYKKLKNRIAKLDKEGTVNEAKAAEYKKKFIEIVGNDLNTASGITLIYDLLKDDVNDATKRYIIEDFDKVLSLDLLENENAQESSDVDSEMEQYINEMISKRAEAKKAKDFATADAIREELAAKGIVLKDTREGTTWTKA